MRGMFEERRYVGPSAVVLDLRPRWMLRFLEEQACHEALSPGQASHHAIDRAGRKLEVVLCRRTHDGLTARCSEAARFSSWEEEMAVAKPFVDPSESWPALPLDAWADTYATLHMWTQIVGKVRLGLAPRVTHWWEVPLY